MGRNIRHPVGSSTEWHGCPWDRNRFVEYAAKHHVNGESLFDQVAARYGDDSHPLLTRPVLANRLIQNAVDSADHTTFIGALDEDKNRYFEKFVETIIEREAREKWIDRSGEPARPLLSTPQHHELLADIALEMWISETASLKSDVFDYLVDLYAEHRMMETHVTSQISRRIRQHALIVATDYDSFRFDHEEFYHYFLGEAVARMVARAETGDVRHVFRVARLPGFVLDVAARGALRESGGRPTFMDTLNEVCAIELRDSFIKDNAGDLAIRLIDVGDLGAVAIDHMSFSVDSLKSRDIHDATFHDCYFGRTALTGSIVRNCSFERCRFEQIDLSDVTQIHGASLRDCEVFSVVRSSEETAIFAPESISGTLREAGFQIPYRHRDAGIEPAVPIETDDLLELTIRMCRVFFRSTGVNEYTFRQRLGSKANIFFDQVLPSLKGYGVVNEIEYKGGGSQRRYRLGISLDDVQRSIEQADGNFEKFLEGIGA